MSDHDALYTLRHDLANPLAALLAETQLLLMEPEKLNEETLTALREIEQLAIRMRSILRGEQRAAP
ncbi:MAG: histidine kinase dimerization/phospho-acceptor domain-containing protein [Gemmatimonadales bacterium]